MVVVQTQPLNIIYSYVCLLSYGHAAPRHLTGFMLALKCPIFQLTAEDVKFAQWRKSRRKQLLCRAKGVASADPKHPQALNLL